MITGRGTHCRVHYRNRIVKSSFETQHLSVTMLAEVRSNGISYTQLTKNVFVQRSQKVIFILSPFVALT